jgi:Flp pilus assembly protein TadB
MSANEGRKSRLDYSDAFIVIWMVALFVSFGVVASLIDQYGVLYNLGQGLFIALFVGAVMFLLRWFAARRTKKAGQTKLAGWIQVRGWDSN